MAITHSHAGRPRRPLLRHVAEMVAVMAAGMFVAAAVLMVVLNVVADDPVTWDDALVQYPVYALLVVAVGMSLPMAAWMLHRGHSRARSYEMAAVMGLPVIPFVGLALLGVVEGAQCGLYCLVSVVAMLALIAYRRDEYAAHAH